MSVDSDLLEMLQFHGFIKEKEKEPFHRFIGGRDEDRLPAAEEHRLEKAIISRINSLQIFLDVIRGLEKLLKEKLTQEIFDLAVGEETISGIATRVYGPLGMPPSEEPKFVFVPQDQIRAIPTRDITPVSVFANLIGIPIEITLREKGIIKGKLSVTEFQYHIRQTILNKVCPALDHGLECGRLTKTEHDYIRDFITVFQFLMFLYQGVKKGEMDIHSDKPLRASSTYLVSNKMIENTINHLIKAGMDPILAEAIKASCFSNNREVKCINPHCNNMFIPKNRKHTHCQECSKPQNYLKEWRAAKADKGKEPPKEDPPPKK